MQDEQAVQADETAEPTAEETPSADAEVAAAVDEQAAQSSGAAAEQAPEVPDDARETIAKAQEHLNSLDMDQERESVERVTKQL